MCGWGSPPSALKCRLRSLSGSCNQNETGRQTPPAPCTPELQAGSVERGHRRAWRSWPEAHSAGFRCCPAPPCLGLPMVGIEAVHQMDDTPGNVIEVGDGREGVQAGGMELVAVLHGQLAKALEVSLLDIADHLCHACRHHHLSPELRDTGASGETLVASQRSGQSARAGRSLSQALASTPTSSRADELRFGGHGWSLACVLTFRWWLGELAPAQCQPYPEQGAGLHAGLHAHCAAGQLLLSTHLHQGRDG